SLDGAAQPGPAVHPAPPACAVAAASPGVTRRTSGGRVRRFLAIAAAALFVSGCSVIPASRFLEAYAEQNPDPQHLRLCHGYACRFVTPVALSPEEWRAVGARFEPPAESAAAERQQVGLAVAQLTVSAGRHAGLAVRQRRDLLNRSDSSQLDCVDETVNTTTLSDVALSRRSAALAS